MFADKSICWSVLCRITPWLVVACGTALFGQTDTGSISGFVYDQSEAVIPGVSVIAVDTERGIRRESETSEAGEFVFRYVEPGIYSLSFEASDFAALTVDGLEVRIGDTATLSPPACAGCGGGKGRGLQRIG